MLQKLENSNNFLLKKNQTRPDKNRDGFFLYLIKQILIQ
jgi:hypothetical protein